MIMQRDKKSEQEILKNGLSGEFWDILMNEIDLNIKLLRAEQKDSQKFKDLPAVEYKLANELLLMKIDYLNKLREMPGEIILSLNDPPTEKEEHDPYGTVEDLEK